MPDVTMKRPASQRRAPGVSYQGSCFMTAGMSATQATSAMERSSGSMEPHALAGPWLERAGQPCVRRTTDRSRLHGGCRPVRSPANTPPLERLGAPASSWPPGSTMESVPALADPCGALANQKQP